MAKKGLATRLRFVFQLLSPFESKIKNFEPVDLSLEKNTLLHALNLYKSAAFQYQELCKLIPLNTFVPDADM